MNQKGVSLTSLVITIIIIIIIAAITIIGSSKPLQEANKVKFQNDLKSAVDALNVYHERAIIRGVSTYKSENLKWDGISDKAENTAKMEDKKHIEEDSIKDIFDSNNVPETLEGIITIEGGKIRVNKDESPQYEWAVEMYSYMEY